MYHKEISKIIVKKIKVIKKYLVKHAPKYPLK